MSVRRFMLIIHPEVQDFVDLDETTYKTDEINKENMNDFCIFITDQKSANTKHKMKYDKQILLKEERENGSKRCTFSTVKHR